MEIELWIRLDPSPKRQKLSKPSQNPITDE